MAELLTRDQILGIARPRTVDVEVAAWGGTVRLRELSVADAAGFAGRQSEDSTVTARLVALSLCDEEGRALFTEAEVAAFAARRGAEAMNALAVAILDLNAMSAKAAEDVAKN